jgi:hypothetical protein
MITMALLSGGAPVPSISRAARNATTPLPSGGSGRIPIGAGFCGITEMQRHEIRVSAVERSLKVFTLIPRIV